MLLCITLSSSVYHDKEFIEGGPGMDHVIASSLPLDKIAAEGGRENPCACPCNISAVIATIIILGIIRKVMLLAV